jgi:hypothetical protein
MGDTPLHRGEFVAARWPDRNALRTINAQSVRYFRLPDESDASGWSLQTLAIADATPRLALHASSNETFTLTNESAVDLAPRLSGDAGEQDRGYALELDAPGPVWREAGEGDFWRVTSHVNPETKPAAVAIPLATRLTFWFSHLPAGKTLRSGLIQLAPGAAMAAVRYRVLDCPGVTEWRTLE